MRTDEKIGYMIGCLQVAKDELDHMSEHHMVKDKETGEEYGWGRVLDYIGVGWEDIPPEQLSLFDMEVMP